MFENNALYCGQSNSRSFELILKVKSLKNPEELVGILHVKADSVVPHEVHVWTIFSPMANFDDGFFPLAGKLESIGKQITKDLFYKRVVTLGGRKGVNSPCHPALFGLLLKLGNDAPDKCIQIDGLLEQFLPA